MADKGLSGQFDPEAGSVGESVPVKETEVLVVEARSAEIAPALDGIDSYSHAITTSQHDGPGPRASTVSARREEAYFAVSLSVVLGSIQVGCMGEATSAQDLA
jgi:hypothetical protein